MTTARRKRVRRVFEAREKLSAVLSIWTERRTASEVCRELSISYTLLDGWQNQAMEGMLSALEPKRKNKERPALNQRLEKLIERKITKRNGALEKLEDRLETVQRKRKTKES